MTVSWHAASYNWVGLEVYCDDVYLYIYIHIMICIYILLLKKSRKVPCWFLLEISKYWAGNHMFKVVAYSLFFFGLFVGESGHGS